MNSKSSLANQPLGNEVEMISNIMYAYAENMPSFVRGNLHKLLKECHIPLTTDDTWIPVKNVIEYFDRVLQQYGPHTLFDMGKAGSVLLPLPPGATNLEDVLVEMDSVHRGIHRNGNAGGYLSHESDKENKTFVLQAYNHYPRQLIKGFLTGYGRRYGNMVRITELPERSTSPEEHWFRITYR